jgi:hypothetical protein
MSGRMEAERGATLKAAAASTPPQGLPSIDPA